MTVHSLQYHDQTSYFRLRMTGHALDWFNQPSVYKTYPDIEVIPLPEHPQFPKMSLSKVLREPGERSISSIPSLEELAQILKLTYSLTAKAAMGDGSFYYRSVASAGALYPTEIYLAVPDSAGFKEGIYHYSIAHSGLAPLRTGDFSSFISQQAFWPEGFVPGLTFFLSAVYFRSSWKYRERAFRYHLLDTGHLLENLLLALSAYQFPVASTYDFNDDEVNRLLGLDDTLEGVLALISLPDSLSETKRDIQHIPDLSDSVKKASRTAQKEIAYPLINECYRAGGRRTSGARGFHSKTLSFQPEPKTWTSHIPFENWPEKMTYPTSVFRRRSKRNFIPEPLPAQSFNALLEGISLNIPGILGVREKFHSPITLGFLTGPVEDATPGFYLLDKEILKLGLIKEGRYTQSMARICLDQMWLANASLHFLFLGSPEDLDKEGGPRAYRYAMMTAGRLGERLYLLSTALGLGCCGIGAFYDQEAADLLSLDEGYRLLYLVAVGVIKRKMF